MVCTGNGIARCDCNAMSGMPMLELDCEFGAADGLRSRETHEQPSVAWRSLRWPFMVCHAKGLVEVDRRTSR